MWRNRTVEKPNIGDMIIDVPVFYLSHISHNFFKNSRRWVTIYSGVHRQHHPIVDFMKEIFHLVFPKLQMINMYGFNTIWNPTLAHQRKRRHKTDDVHDISQHEKLGQLPLGF